jgi:hypothetical protein
MMGRDKHLDSRDFPLADILNETRIADPQLAESTIRTHVASRMCANAPDHRGTTYADLNGSIAAFTANADLPPDNQHYQLDSATTR